MWIRLLPAIALTSCAFEEPPETTTTSQELGTLVTLRAYWSAANGDNALSTNPWFAPAGYSQYRIEGRIFSPHEPRPNDTVALYTWYGAARGDYLTTTNPYWAGQPGDYRNNYSFVRLEGYVHQFPVAGTLPLQLWWGATNADNHTTSDPRWTVDTTATRSGDYRYSREEGFIFPPTTPQLPSLKENFHWGEMGNAPRGERDVLVLLMEYDDAPMRHAPSDVDALLFGPTYPNVRAYTNVASQQRFTWRRGAVLGPYVYPDDPTTSANEATYVHSWNPDAYDNATSPTIAFAHLKAASGRRVEATSSSAFTPAQNGADQSRNTFGFADLDGGTLDSGDFVALKANNGMWLREINGVVRADAANSTTAMLFTINSSTPGPIQHGATVTFRSAASGRYLLESSATTSSTDAETVIATSAPLQSAHFFTLEKALCPDIDRQAKAMLAAAIADGYDFRVHDRDGNGVVDKTELAIVIVHSAPSMWDGGAVRAIANVVAPGAITLATEQAASLGEDASLMTYAHELLHLAGTGHEMYGGNNTSQLSTMSATVVGVRDSRETFMLDPWHRIRFGWAEPEIQALNTAGADSFQLSSTLRPARPLVLYDPRRYNTWTKLGQYFILEYRDWTRPYDTGAGGGNSGIVVWQVTEQPGTDAVHVQLFEGGRFVRPIDGNVSLQYADGTASGFRVAAGSLPGITSTMVVEWTHDARLRPRIDGGVAESTPGSTIFVDGMFPASSSGVSARLVNLLSGTTYTLPITSWSATRVWATIPSTVPAGGYLLYLINNGERSNRHPIILDP